MFVQHIYNFIGMKIYVSGHLYTLEIKLILPDVCFKITNLFLEILSFIHPMFYSFYQYPSIFKFWLILFQWGAIIR